MGKIVLRLDRVMLERKISLGELAERVGISNVNMSKIKTIRLQPFAFQRLPQYATYSSARRGIY